MYSTVLKPLSQRVQSFESAQTLESELTCERTTHVMFSLLDTLRQIRCYLLIYLLAELCRRILPIRRISTRHCPWNCEGVKSLTRLGFVIYGLEELEITSCTLVSIESSQWLPPIESRVYTESRAFLCTRLLLARVSITSRFLDCPLLGQFCDRKAINLVWSLHAADFSSSR